MTTTKLLSLSMEPIIRAVKRRLQERKIRALYRLADYFRWQQYNGNQGLRDTHKRIVNAEAELRDMR